MNVTMISHPCVKNDTTQKTFSYYYYNTEWIRIRQALSYQSSKVIIKLTS